MQITTGRQIKAARALIGMDQPTLGKAAGLHRNAVGYWEGKNTIPRREPVGVRRIREALTAAGVTIYSAPAPGVALVQAVSQRPCVKPSSVAPSVHDAQFPGTLTRVTNERI
jgi:hypothetical protein